MQFTLSDCQDVPLLDAYNDPFTLGIGSTGGLTIDIADKEAFLVMTAEQTQALVDALAARGFVAKQ